MSRQQHHDILIQQLRSQIYELKKSEEDYYLLQEQLTRLETKYRLLNDEKISNDKEHQSKHDSYTKLIQQTKHELGVLEDELKYKQTDLREIETEAASLKRICEEKNNDIERLRMERNALMAEDEELKLQDQRIDHQMNRMHTETQGLKAEYEKVQNQSQYAIDKNRQYEKYINQLSEQGKSFVEDIRSLEDRMHNSEKQLQGKTQNLRNIQKQISDASMASKQLEIDIAEVNSMNQKYKGQISHYIRLYQSEVNRANEILKNIQILESSLKMVHQQNLEVNEQIKELQGQNSQIADINMKLDLDNENCEKHIDILGSQNQYLMQQLNKLAEEDEVVRALLLRKRNNINNNKEGSVKLSRTSHQSRF